MSFAVLVLSCDKYAHVWPGFFKTFDKYFPGCKWPIYLGSNQTKFSHPHVKTLLTGDDPDWSTSYLRILEQIPEAQIFVILEDLMLASPMNEEHFRSAVEFMERHQAKHIKYYKPIPPDGPTDHPDFGEYIRGRPYRASVVCFWNKEYLKSLLVPGENPWNFEIMGSYRTSYTDGFYMMKNTLCEFANLIEKGHWYPSAVEFARLEELDIGLERRPVLSGASRAKSWLQILVFSIINRINWRTRVSIMNWLRRILISY